MKPLYMPDMVSPPADLNAWIDGLPWLTVTSARRECFMTPAGGTSYTYGEGKFARTYTSIPMDDFVTGVQALLARHGLLMNGCFLNLYENAGNALGWHADDFDGMNHGRAVVVVSFGEPREIWWRSLGDKGVVPAEQRQLLAPGSVFVMPPGFQHTHEHRIPKGDRPMGRRVSLTFRAFKDTP